MPWARWAGCGVQARQAAGDLLRAAPRGPVPRIPTLTGLIDAVSVSAGVDEAVRTRRMLPPGGICRVTSSASCHATRPELTLF